MVNMISPGLPVDVNGNAIQGGGSTEVAFNTSTQSTSRTFSFSTAPKQVILQTLTNVDGIMVWQGTSTMADTGDFIYVGPGKVITLNTTSSGPFYYRSYSATISLLNLIATL